jgi:hypothetical protein
VVINSGVIFIGGFCNLTILHFLLDIQGVWIQFERSGGSLEVIDYDWRYLIVKK